MQTTELSPKAVVLRAAILIGTLTLPLARAGAQQAVVEVPRNEKSATAAASPAMPSLDEALRQALENNPDILVAKAKLQEADAVLNRTRLRVAQEVLSLRAKAEAEHKRAAEAQKLAGSAAITTAELRNALEGVATSESEFQYALGKAKGYVSTMMPAGSGFGGGGLGDGAQRAAPRGPGAAAIRKALEKTGTFEFKPAPLADVLAQLSEAGGTNFVLDKAAFQDASRSPDLTVEISIKAAPLGAVLQAVEDLNPPLCFVVREYGILLTVDGSRASEDACRVADFWQADTESEPKP